MLTFLRTRNFANLPSTIAFTLGVLIGISLHRHDETWHVSNVFYVLVLAVIFLAFEFTSKLAIDKHNMKK